MVFLPKVKWYFGFKFSCDGKVSSAETSAAYITKNLI